MKKILINGIAIAACVALCAAVRSGSTESEVIPVKPLKPFMSAEVGANSEIFPQAISPAYTPIPKPEVALESEPEKTEEATAEKENDTNSL